MIHLLFAFASLLPQAKASVSPAVSTYRNAELHFSFEYPSGFSTKDFAEEITAEAKTELTKPGQAEALKFFASGRPL